MLEREVDNQNKSGISMKSPLTEICWHNCNPHREGQWFLKWVIFTPGRDFFFQMTKHTKS